ncbi:hypothetical protein F511_18670 [Dorcoceras hygrometricum]|uniref:Uncharacterized protein n=1 Tax=Dorcoceras hygrometricum TaxID=472368 RepID=A0A2Z7DHC0_9LAMI|nr:hypothetical protein F511_18670 [Dorcoceras hygrometricum]
MSVQNIVDRIEGQSHGHATAKQTVEPQEEAPEKNTIDMEEASKMMTEGILAYVKAVVSHTTQSTNQGSFQHKGMDQGAGSSRAGETRRSVPTTPGLEERLITKPIKKNYPGSMGGSTANWPRNQYPPLETEGNSSVRQLESSKSKRVPKRKATAPDYR